MLFTYVFAGERKRKRERLRETCQSLAGKGYVLEGLIS